MKKVKLFLIAFTAAVLTLSLPLALTVSVTGCGTLPGGGTNNAAQVTAAALILQNTAYSGALAAITPPTGNPSNAEYFKLASQAIGEFATGTNFSPAVFQADLLQVAAPQATNIWVQLGVGAVIDLYTAYFSQYVTGSVAGSTNAVIFLTAVQNGFNQATGVASKTNTPPLPPAAVMQRLVLPRPFK